LVAGLITAITVYQTAKPEEKLGIVGLDVPSKHDILQVERMNGKAGLAANDFLNWFYGLWQGRELGDTILFLSIAGFCGCLYLAHLKTDYPPAEKPRSDEDN
jgi:hypothetical protein